VTQSRDIDFAFPVRFKTRKACAITKTIPSVSNMPSRVSGALPKRKDSATKLSFFFASVHKSDAMVIHRLDFVVD